MTAASTGETRRRESSETTVCFSARASARILLAELRARRGAVGGDRERSRDLPERGELLLALGAAGEMALERVPLLGLECVEGVAGAQFVEFGVHDPSSAPSSRSSRRRASPANILLLIVPSGTPSLSASSDCE